MRGLRLAGVVALVVLVLDQLAKQAVVRALPFNGGEAIVPGFFNLVHAHNRGAAFGLLNNPGQSWQTWLFAAASMAAMAVIVKLLATVRDARLLWGLAFILGGAAGNLADRLRQGYVVDFLDFHYGTLHWPAFNVADAAICLGAALVIWASLGNADDVSGTA